ncbi:hypothetical protein KHQ81_10135 [Mycoplasmatota bacterium]|nr:hypothetical protein KHQ81_10135 [Mycoplasmatota bacterium]
MKRFFTLVLLVVFASVLVACNDNKTTKDKDNEEVINTVISNLELPDLTAVTQNFDLPASDSESGVSFTWTSGNEQVLKIQNNVAEITRPAVGQSDATVKLILIATKGDAFKTKEYSLTVIATPQGAQAKLDEAVTGLDITSVNDITNIVENSFSLNAISTVHDSVNIVWTSSNDAVVSLAEPGTSGIQIATVTRTENDENVTLTATLTIDDNGNTLTETKTFDLVITKLADTDEGKVAEVKENLRLFRIDFVIGDLTLPTTGAYNIPIVWESNNTVAVSIAGGVANVTRQELDTEVTLTATITLNDVTETKTFRVFVIGTGNTYTYREYTAGESIINPHATTAGVASDLYDYITAGLYKGDFDWASAGLQVGDFRNMDLLNYDRLPYLAKSLPIDVNGDQKTWNIELREDLKWEDGTPITVDDYLYAYKMLIDPKLVNDRASNLYQDIPVVNAEDYFFQGTGYKGCYVMYDNQVEGSLVTSISEDACTIEYLGEHETSRTVQNYPETLDFSEVGVHKVNDHTLQFVLQDPLTSWDLRGQLTSGITGPVHEGLYEAGMNPERTRTTYGTSADTIMSYGPYKLVTWETEKLYLYEKNEHFFDKDNYRFDKIRDDVIGDQSAYVSEFKEGRLDIAGVGGDYYDEFKENPNVKLSPTTQTYRYYFNIADRPDENTNPMMKYDKFREGIYYAINREEMSNTVVAPSFPQQALLTSKYIIADFSTISFRGTEQGESVIADRSPETFGYDPEYALELFNDAYAEAVAAGDITDGEKVTIELAMYDSERNWTLNRWVKNCVETSFDAVEGGSNEGKFEFVIQPYSGDALDAVTDAGNFDMSFGAWYGMDFWPIELIGYVYNNHQAYMQEKGFTPGDTELTVELPYKNAGKEDISETRTYDEWFQAVQPGGDLYDVYEGKDLDCLNILAAMEKSVLDLYMNVPLYSAVTTVVYSDSIVFESPEFHNWMGWGGLKYMYKNEPDVVS